MTSLPIIPASPRGACPKHMTFGPCGGVLPNGGCELPGHHCPFADDHSAVTMSGGTGPVPPLTRAGAEILEIAGRRPLVFTGFPAPPIRADMVDRVAEPLLGIVDAVLSGDAGNSRTQFSPSYRAALISGAGLRVWNGFNARDRNRDALARELFSLREIGVAGVHCVTGDHPGIGDRPDAEPVFDLESTTMLPLVRSLGMLSSSAESPAAHPRRIRPARVAAKKEAGSQFTMLQYCGGAAEVSAFADACAEIGAAEGMLPGVPLAVDVRGARILDSFQPGSLPDGLPARIAQAEDPYVEGVRAAVEFGTEMLEIAGVAGVVIAGAAAPGAELDFARALATVARELGGGS